MLSIKVDKSQVDRTLRDLRRATKDTAAAALTDTVERLARRQMPSIMRKHLDRPTKQTQRSGLYRKADPSRLKAKVFFKRFAEPYIERTIYGGRDKKAKPVPIKLKTNRYGNIQSLRGGQRLDRLLAQKTVFTLEIDGKTHVFRRVRKNKSDVLLIVFDRPKTKPVFPFFEEMQRRSEKQLPISFARELRKRYR